MIKIQALVVRVWKAFDPVERMLLALFSLFCVAIGFSVLVVVM
jgi:hypothetical protein